MCYVHLKSTRMSNLKRKSFTLEEKARIIMRLEAGETNISVGKELGVASSTIATMWKCRNAIKNNFKNGEKSVGIKRMRSSNYEAVDELLMKWFKTEKSQNPIPGPVFLAKADEFARKLGIDHFKCSAGWIQRFRKRHGITYGKISNDAATQEMLCEDLSKNEDAIFDECESVKECREKWKNIRTVFRRHLPSPSGVPPKNNYYLHNELQFLMPIISSSSSKKSLARHAHNHSDMEMLEVKVEEEEIQEEQDPLQNDPSDVDTLQPEVNQFVQTEKKNFNDSMNSTFPAENNCHKIKETNLSGSSSSEADEQFLLSLKWDLGEMNSKQKRLFKKGVYDLIDKIMESGS